jgi:hypothetical protein
MTESVCVCERERERKKERDEKRECVNKKRRVKIARGE